LTILWRKYQNHPGIGNELICMSEKGELDKSVAYLKKASKNALTKLYSGAQDAKRRKTNEFLTDMIISKWSDILSSFKAIEHQKLTDR
jgi:hypothetical protein